MEGHIKKGMDWRG